MRHRRAIQLSLWLYRHLLILYPAEFRRAYGEEMVQVVATQWRQTANAGALLRLWLAAFGDLFTNAMEEVFMTAERKGQSTLVIGLVFGLVAGILGSVGALTSAATIGALADEVLSNIVLFGLVALALGAGLTAARISKNALTGLWVGLLVGIIASLIANTARVGYSIAFYDVVRNDPGEIRDWIHRGSSTFVNYLIEDRIGGYVYTTLGLGLISGVFGIAGGLLSKAWDMWRVS